MKFRKLRIAWSLGFGLLSVLLIALCVRSYSKWDRLLYHFPSGSKVVLSSWNREFAVLVDYTTATGNSRGFEFESQLTSQLHLDPSERGFVFLRNTIAVAVGMPDWFLIMLSAAIAGIPWARRRFSLRTLLIATTLVAVVLGLAVYAAGK